ncbi:MAG: hypothetical protein AAF901_14065, partial [Bacteroidota bacterium]
IADREGYILAYLSNENAEEVAIHWDDFTVYHGKTNVVQAQAYYPYGGRFDQYQRTASTKNVFLYNEGAERLEDFSFNLDETKHRIYDPWGRLGWWQIDPKADLDINVSWSPYNYAYANSIRYNDPYGDCPKCWKNIRAGFSRIVNMYRDGVKRNAYDRRNAPRASVQRVTGNRILDAGIKLAGGDTFRKAADGEHRAQGQLIMGGLTSLAGIKGGKHSIKSKPSIDLGKRAKEIHGTLPKATQSRTTTAVAEVTNPNGSTSYLVGSSEKRLRPAQRAALNANETAVAGDGHAEVTVINSAQSNGQNVSRVGASRPICDRCQRIIDAVGAKPASPLKNKPVLREEIDN